MSDITSHELTPQQEAVIVTFINQGKSLAYQELLEYFSQELYLAEPEDPYYAYYIKHVIEKITERYNSIKKPDNG